MAYDGVSGSSPEQFAQVLHADRGQPIKVPGGDALLDCEFVRSGPDLILVAPDGSKILVVGYFSVGQAPDLVGATAHIDAVLAGKLAGPMAAGQFAQAGGGGNAVAIGTVQIAKGTVEVRHANGTKEILKAGDPVYADDVMVTSKDGSVGVAFDDGTTFSLGSSGRMVLDDMVYDAATKSGSGAISLVKGSFAFVSGQIPKSHPDALTIKTPVMTMGIRGTAGGGNESTVAMLPEAGGVAGEISISTQGGSITLNQPGTATTITNPLAPPSTPFTMSPAQIGALAGSAFGSLPNPGALSNSFREATGVPMGPPAAAPGQGEGQGQGNKPAPGLETQGQNQGQNQGQGQGPSQAFQELRVFQQEQTQRIFERTIQQIEQRERIVDQRVQEVRQEARQRAAEVFDNATENRTQQENAAVAEISALVSQMAVYVAAAEAALVDAETASTESDTDALLAAKVAALAGFNGIDGNDANPHVPGIQTLYGQAQDIVAAHLNFPRVVAMFNQATLLRAQAETAYNNVNSLFVAAGNTTSYGDSWRDNSAIDNKVTALDEAEDSAALVETTRLAAEDGAALEAAARLAARDPFIDFAAAAAEKAVRDAALAENKVSLAKAIVDYVTRFQDADDLTTDGINEAETEFGITTALKDAVTAYGTAVSGFASGELAAFNAGGANAVTVAFAALESAAIDNAGANLDVNAYALNINAWIDARDSAATAATSAGTAYTAAELAYQAAATALSTAVTSASTAALAYVNAQIDAANDAVAAASAAYTELVAANAAQDQVESRMDAALDSLLGDLGNSGATTLGTAIGDVAVAATAASAAAAAVADDSGFSMAAVQSANQSIQAAIDNMATRVSEVAAAVARALAAKDLADVAVQPTHLAQASQQAQDVANQQSQKANDDYAQALSIQKEVLRQQDLMESYADQVTQALVKAEALQALADAQHAQLAAQAVIIADIAESTAEDADAAAAAAATAAESAANSINNSLDAGESAVVTASNADIRTVFNARVTAASATLTTLQGDAAAASVSLGTASSTNAIVQAKILAANQALQTASTALDSASTSVSTTSALAVTASEDAEQAADDAANAASSAHNYRLTAETKAAAAHAAANDADAVARAQEAAEASKQASTQASTATEKAAEAALQVKTVSSLQTQVDTAVATASNAVKNAVEAAAWAKTMITATDAASAAREAVDSHTVGVTGEAVEDKAAIDSAYATTIAANGDYARLQALYTQYVTNQVESASADREARATIDSAYSRATQALNEIYNSSTGKGARADAATALDKAQIALSTAETKAAAVLAATKLSDATTAASDAQNYAAEAQRQAAIVETARATTAARATEITGYYNSVAGADGAVAQIAAAAQMKAYADQAAAQLALAQSFHATVVKQAALAQAQSNILVKAAASDTLATRAAIDGELLTAKVAAENAFTAADNAATTVSANNVSNSIQEAYNALNANGGSTYFSNLSVTLQAGTAVATYKAQIEKALAEAETLLADAGGQVDLAEAAKLAAADAYTKLDSGLSAAVRQAATITQSQAQAVAAKDAADTAVGRATDATTAANTKLFGAGGGDAVAQALSTSLSSKLADANLASINTRLNAADGAWETAKTIYNTTINAANTGLKAKVVTLQSDIAKILSDDDTTNDFVALSTPSQVNALLAQKYAYNAANKAQQATDLAATIEAQKAVIDQKVAQILALKAEYDSYITKITAPAQVVAGADVATASEDGSFVTINVLANDKRADGAALNTASVTVDTNPSHGTATISGTNVVYTPTQANYNGTDTFTVTIHNTVTINGVSYETTSISTVTVTITPTNDAPVLNVSVTPTLTAINEQGPQSSQTGSAGHDTIVGSAISDVLSGGAGNDVLVGETGRDTLAGGNGADTLTGGSGNDIFVVGSGESGSTASDVVTDFVTGADRIQFTGMGGIAYATTPYGSAETSVTGIVDAIKADNAVTNKAVFFTLGGNGYVYVKGAGTGVSFDDTLVRLNGVTTAPAATDLVGVTGGGTSAMMGSLVSDLLTGRVTDGDSPSVAPGIAITALDSSNGTWQYSSNSGVTWTSVSTPGGDQAFLLVATDRIRFVPNTGWNGSFDANAGTPNPAISFKAWDRTSGTAGQLFTGVAASSAFSSATLGTNLTVNAVAYAPVVTVVSTPYALTAGGSVALSISLSSVTDTVSIEISGVPANATLTYSGGTITAPSAGQPYVLTQAQLAGLTLNPAAGHSTAVSLAVTVIATDGASTEAVSSAINVTFGVQDVVVNGAYDGSASVRPLNLIGGVGNDTMVGGTGGDTLSGGAGNDTLSGGAGADTFIGSAGADRIFGGTASTDTSTGDVLSYAAESAAVIVNLTTGTATSSGGSAILSGIEHVIGGSGADSLTGSSGANSLVGGAGNDVLVGSGGADTLTGGAGSDSFRLNAASESTVSATDTITDFVSGTDTILLQGASYSYLTTAYTYSSSASATVAAIVANAAIINAAVFFTDGTDGYLYVKGGGAGTSFDGALVKLTGVTSAPAKASLSGIIGDLIAGTSGNDALTGTSGSEVLSGGSGDDTFVGTAGTDSIVGGSGTDKVNYGAQSTATIIDLASGTVSGAGGTATLSGIENVQTGSGADTVTGDSGANYLDTGFGADTLIGGGGADTLMGSGDTDVFQYVAASDSTAAATDTITDFGNGGDTIQFQGADYAYLRGAYTFTTNVATTIAAIVADTRIPSAVVFFTDGSSGYLYVKGAGGGTSYDATLIKLEGVTSQPSAASLSGIGSELLIGTSAGETLTGDAGTDTLVGAAGNDVFRFTSGTDTVAPNPDVIGDFTSGDTLQFQGMTGIALVNGSYAYATSATATVAAIAADGRFTNAAVFFTDGTHGYLYVKGAGTGTSYDGSLLVLANRTTALTLSDVPNIVAEIRLGTSGADTLSGDAGADTLVGGAGADTFRILSAGDSSTSAPDVITDFVSGTDTIRLEGIAGVALVPSYTYAGSVAATVTSIVANTGISNAAVFFTDGTNGYLYVKGAGTGTSFDTALVELTNQTTAPSAADLPGLAGELVVGTSGSDTLTGGAGDEVISGGAGNDVAIYSGNMANYSISMSGGKLIITDTRGTSPDGTDTIDSVETLRFADGDLAVQASGTPLVKTWGYQSGSSYVDQGWAAAIDGSGNTYLVGGTDGTGLASPYLPNALNNYLGSSGDGFIVKRDSSGAVLWSKYIGTGNADDARAAEVDSSGNLWVLGVRNNGTEIYLSKFDPSGTELSTTTFGAGGFPNEPSSGLALDSAGNAFVMFSTSSSTIAGQTPTGYDSTNAGGGDMALLKVNSAGTVVWSTFFGGAYYENMSEVATDSSGNVYLTGFVDDATGMTMSGGADTTYNGGQDGFVAKFDSSGNLVYSSFIGTSGTDRARGVLALNNGEAWVVGFTSADLGATAGAYDTTFGGGYDIFLDRYGASGDLLYRTFIGSSGSELGVRMAADAAGNLFIAGNAGITPPMAVTDGSTPADNNGFLLVMDSTATTVKSFSYTGIANVLDMEIGPNGSVVLTGTADSNFVNSSGGTFGGQADAFMIRYAAEYGSTYVGAMTLEAGAGNDVLSASEDIAIAAGAGNDTITGSSGDDTVLGNDGNDTFIASAGDDSFVGGSGTDSAVYTGADGLLANLTDGTVEINSVTLTTGQVARVNGGTDTFISIEALTGGAGDDIFAISSIGGGNTFSLKGAAGDDTYFLMADGDNQLTGTLVIDDSAGSDTLDVSFLDMWMLQGFTRTADDLILTLTTEAGGGQVIVKNHFTTSPMELFTDGFDDGMIVTGITGTAAGETLVGTIAAETLVGNGGDDDFWGGGGADTFIGGGEDWANFGMSVGAVNMTDALDVTTGFGTYGTVLTAAGQTITMYGIQGLTGSIYNDTLQGGSANTNHFTWWMEGGDGADTLISNANNTGISYEIDPAGIVVNLSGADVVRGADTVVSGTGLDGWGNIDTLIGNFSNIEGSDFDDVLAGMSSGYGSMWFNPGGGSDDVTGGADWDGISYSDADGAVVVNLSTSSVVRGSDTIAAGTALDGGGDIDTLTNIDAVNGGDYADLLVGNDGSNSFHGGQGADTIQGGQGWDAVGYEVWGDDTPTHGVSVNMSASSVIVSVNGANVTVAAGTAYDSSNAVDVLTDIETVYGSQYNDTMIGGGGRDDFWGNDGNDYLDVGVPSDVGERSLDQAQGGLGNDTIVYRTFASLSGGDGIDTLKIVGGGADLTYSYHLHGFETIDLSDGAETVLLNGSTVTYISSNDVLTIKGDSADSVVGGSGWSLDSTETIDGQLYDVYVKPLIDVANEGGAPSYKPDFATLRLDHDIQFLEAVQVNTAGTNIARSAFGTASSEMVSPQGDPRVQIIGRYDGAGSADFYSVTLEAGEILTLDIDHGYPSFDSQLWVYDADGNQLAHNDDGYDGGLGSSSGLDSNITFTADTAGTYHFAVTALNDDPANPGDGGQTDPASYVLNAIITPTGSSTGFGTRPTMIAEAAAITLYGSASGDTFEFMPDAAGLFTQTITIVPNSTQTQSNGAETLLLTGLTNAGISISGYARSADGNNLIITFSTGGQIIVEEHFLGTTSLTLRDLDTNTDWTVSSGLTADASNGVVVGSLAGETLSSSGGINTIYGGGGADTFIGSDDDTVTFANSGSAVIMSTTLDGNGDRVGTVDGAAVVFQGIGTIVGSSSADTLFGSGVTTLVGGAGADAITGDATTCVSYALDPAGVVVNLTTGTATDGWGGADTLTTITNVIGTQFDDSLTGGTGNDTLDGWAGDDDIAGGDGADTLIGGTGSNSLSGGAGNDLIVSGELAIDVINGGAGDDIIDVWAAASASVTTGSGADIVYVGNPDSVTVISDFDVLYDTIGYSIVFQTATYAGTNPFGDGHMRLQDVAGSAVLQLDVDGSGSAFGWTDWVVLTGVSSASITTANFDPAFNPDGTEPGATTSDGSSDADSWVGSAGADTYEGLAGNDSIWGSLGNDVLYGGDSIGSASGDDVIRGSWGNDTIYGGDGADRLYGDYGNNTIDGGTGDDTISSYRGSDVITGGDGHDLITGGAFVDAGAGMDRVLAAGTSTITLGAGADIVQVYPYYTVNGELPVVTDFDVSEDKIDVYGGAGSGPYHIFGSPFDDPSHYRFTDVGSDTVLQYYNNTTWVDQVKFLNLSGASFSYSNFASGLTVFGTANGDTLSGYTLGDTLVGGDGGDTLSGYSGGDAFVYLGGSSESSTSSPDRILDFTSGDTIQFKGMSGISYHQAAFNWAGSIASTISAIDANSSITDQVTFFTDGTDGWLYVKGIGTGTSHNGTLIKLDDVATAPAGYSISGPVTNYGQIEFMGTSGADTLNGTSGDDLLRGLGGSDILIGNAGNDTLVGGAGVDAMDGGAGADVFLLANGDFAAGETIEGGYAAGVRDTIRLTDGAVTVTVDSNIHRVDAIDLGYDAAHNLSISAQMTAEADANDDGTSGDVLVYASTVNNAGVTIEATTLDLWYGNRLVVDGTNLQGNDLVQIQRSRLHYATAGDAGINLGAGNDVVVISDGGTVTDAHLAYLAGVETLEFDYLSVVYLGANSQGAGIVKADGSGATSSMVIDASARTSGIPLITLLGGTAADTLTGGAGADTLVGGAGNDSMTGGLGADLFIFTGSEHSSSETINGTLEASTLDTIQVSNTSAQMVSLDSNISYIDVVDVGVPGSNALAISNAMVATADANKDGTGGDLLITASQINSSGIYIDASAVTSGDVTIQGAKLTGNDQIVIDVSQLSGTVLPVNFNAATWTMTTNALYSDAQTVTQVGATSVAFYQHDNSSSNEAGWPPSADWYYTTTATQSGTLDISWTFARDNSSYLAHADAWVYNQTKGTSVHWTGAAAALAVDYGDVIKFQIQAGNYDYLNVATNTLTVTYNVAGIDLGAGNDTMTVTGSGVLVDDNFAAIAHVETLIHTGLTSVTLGANSQYAGISTLNGTAASGGFVANASGRSQGIVLKGGNGIDTLTGGSGADAIEGNGGNDSLVMSAGNDTLEGGAGADVFVLAHPATEGVTNLLDFTYGTDSLYQIYASPGAYYMESATQVRSLSNMDSGFDFGGDNPGSVEFNITDWGGYGSFLSEIDNSAGITGSSYADMLVFAGTTANQTLSGGGSLDSLMDFTANGNTLDGGDGDDMIYGGAGADDLVGGLGDDIFMYRLASELDAGEAINGGSGTDTLALGNDAGSLQSYDLSSNMISVDRIGFADGNISVILGEPSVSTSYWNSITGQIGIGGATSLTGALTSGVTVDSTGLGGGSSIVVDASLLSGDDTFMCGVGDDTLSGGCGNDNLAGNGGADLYVFEGGTGTAGSLGRVGQLGTDTVTDFASTYDSIVLKDATFGLGNTGTLTNGVNYFETNTALSGGGANYGTGAGIVVIGGGSSIEVWYSTDMSQASTGNSYQVAALAGSNDTADVAAADFKLA